MIAVWLPALGLWSKILHKRRLMGKLNHHVLVSQEDLKEVSNLLCILQVKTFHISGCYDVPHYSLFLQ